MVFIENKKEKGGRMEPEQIEMHLQAMHLGHEVYEVRTWKRFEEIVNESDQRV